ncbi:dual oxidase 2-like isoform X2 [Apostichopus japonicus]|uniref:dual oxidase 2-like isoform X2 n=1 Tax=Stichopus japonicus TaxID=307972 RepID=UPI003AB3442A
MVSFPIFRRKLIGVFLQVCCYCVLWNAVSGHPLNVEKIEESNRDSINAEIGVRERRQLEPNEWDLGLFEDGNIVEYESHNGWYNNADRPDFGGSETPLMRSMPAAYSDGSYSLSGADRPNPMEVSETLSKGEAGLASNSDKSVLLVFFGEHIVHEIVDTHRPSCPPEYVNVDIPENRRSSFSDAKQMYFKRSAEHDNDSPQVNNPRQQLNVQTAWLDGSSIYGTTHSWSSFLRSYHGGRLAFDENNFEYPERNKEGLPMTNPASPFDSVLKESRRLHKFGNARGHETPYLFAIGILMYRWHNYWADLFKQNTEWRDERIFQESRKWVIATYQKIAFYDWLPAFLNLSEKDMKMLEYAGYKTYINPGITHEFQAAAMRFGHTMVPAAVYKRNKYCVFSNLTQTGGNRMCNVFWNSQNISENVAIEEIILGMASQRAEREDHVIVEDLRTFSYGPHGYSRVDLVATDIMRGRDHGLPDYNTAREMLGLKAVDSFLDIVPNNSTITAEKLRELLEMHGDVRKLDLWTGGMMESTSEGPGELFTHIILDQFSRIRDGDRFWFENQANGHFTEKQIDYIRNITIYDVITLTTDIDGSDIQKNPFYYRDGDPCFSGSLDWFQNEGRAALDTNLEQCTPLEFFNFFEGSWFSFGATLLSIVGWIVGVITIVFILAKRQERMGKRARQLYVRKKSSTRQLSDEVVRKHSVAEEWCGPKETRMVEVGYSASPRGLRVYETGDGDILRTIDLAKQKITVVLSSDNGGRTLLLKVEKEYDLVLIFDHVDNRTLFLDGFEEFLGDSDVMTGRLDMKDKELRKMVVTKEKRQQNVERFVRAAFVQAFEPDVLMDDNHEPENREIFSTEMTKSEFADILKLTQDSMFVELMFELADKDKNGTISFREFLDVTVIFAEGKPEDKLEMMFNMYDVDNSGELSRKELEGMLKSLLEMARTSMEQEQVEEAIAAMFINSGLENKEELTFDDFKTLMAEHMEQLSNASLKIKGSDLMQSVENDSRRGSLPASSENRRFSLLPDGKSAISSMARRFSLKDGGESKKAATSSGSSRKSSGRRVSDEKLSIRTIKKQYPRNAFQRKLRSYIAFTENHMSHIFCLILYLLVLCGIVLYKLYVYTYESEHKGMRAVTGLGLSITRGAAAAQMFTFSTLLVTVSRNFITKLRETVVSKYIPLDSSLAFHKFVAYLAVIFSVVHALGHFSNFLHVTSQPADDVTCLVRATFHRSNELPKFHHWVWGTVTGVSGVLLVMVATVMYTFATPYARRRVFRFFWTAHQLYIVLFILCIVHGSARLVQTPDFFKFFLFPAIMFTIDKLISVSRRKVEIPVLKAQLLPSEVTNVVFTRPSTFEYKSGQWVRIACSALGAHEYHPFTLTSAPHEDNLSVHVRAVGPWTTALRKVYDPETLRDKPLPKIFLDGPYGEGHQDWFKFEVSVLIGAGIGVTPFASILKDIVHNSAKRAQFPCKKVYFIWLTRTQKHFEWFTDIIRKVEESDEDMFVESHIFITQFFQEFDLRTTMLYVCERHFYKVSSRSLFTGLRSETHFGRPDFVSFLQSIKDNHSGVCPIGVFSCGPPQMNTGLVSACTALNKVHGKVAFSHHSETF